MSNQQKSTTTGKERDIKTAVSEGSVEVNSKQNLKTKGHKLTKEIGGPKGLEPTRYGDWEAKGRCYDF